MRRIMARPRGRLAVLGVALVLAGCTALRVVYHQAPSLTYWWIDGYADLDNRQTAQVRADLDALFAWHRQEELPRLAELLRDWQRLAPNDITADQVCQQFDRVRERLARTATEAVPPLARLALQLSPAQLDHLARQQVKNNREFEEDFIAASPGRVLDRRTERAQDRLETFYGRLSDAQRSLLRQQLAASPFDAARTRQERLVRQADLLATIRQAQAEPASAGQRIQAHLNRFTDSPTPGYNAYLQSTVQHGCRQLALIHNSTTAQQRQRAVATLQQYGADLRTLASPG